MPTILTAARGLMPLCAALFLAACATTRCPPHETEVVDRTRLVQVPRDVFVDVGDLADPVAVPELPAPAHTDSTRGCAEPPCYSNAQLEDDRAAARAALADANARLAQIRGLMRRAAAE